MTESTIGIDRDQMQTFLRVVEAVDRLPHQHPDAVAVRGATARIFKTVKQRPPSRAAGRGARRRRRRDRGHRHRRARPHRRRDRRASRWPPRRTGADRRHAAPGARLLHLQDRATPRSTRSTTSSARPAPRCNRSRRDARTDLTGRRALLTGGRAKIGMYIALRLLRDGAHTTITTRFPQRRGAPVHARCPTAPTGCTGCGSSASTCATRPRWSRWPTRSPPQGPLDILINNAAQTVRRSPGAYAPLVAAESAPLPDGPLPELMTFGAHQRRAPAGAGRLAGRAPLPQLPDARGRADRAGADRRLGRRRRGSPRAPRSTPAAWCPTCTTSTAGPRRVDEVDPLELLEVQLCNTTAPFILISRLRPAMAASPARRTYVVNVSAMEGQFGRGYKGPGHPHTNMAKAALNMLTRTSAAGDARDRRHPDDQRRHRLDHRRAPAPAPRCGWPRRASTRRSTWSTARPGSTTRSCAARPGEDLYGCFLKDYRAGRLVGRVAAGHPSQVAPVGGLPAAFVVFDLPHPSLDAGAGSPPGPRSGVPCRPTARPSTVDPSSHSAGALQPWACSVLPAVATPAAARARRAPPRAAAARAR